MKAYLLASIACCSMIAQPNIPFIGTVKLGSRKLVLQHIAHGTAQLNTKDELGNFPLHYAVNLDSYEITEILLQHGAQVNIQNKENVTPLHIAVKHRNKNIVRLLLQFGAHPNVTDAHGNSPLHLTASYAHIKCGLEIIALLRTHGAQTTICNAAQKTTHAHIVERLQTLNSKHPIHEKNIMTALESVHPEQAATTAKPEYARIQRKYVTCAKTANTHKMRKLLTRTCLNINAQYGASKRSALMHALRHNRHEMAQLLIDAGIDTSLCDCNGMTAHDYARMYKQPSIAARLQQQSA